MIKLIVTIDTLRGIIEEPNSTIKAFQAKKIGTSKVIHIANDEYFTLEGLPALLSRTCPPKEHKWVTGDSKLFKDMILRADELYITQVNGFHNTNTEFPSFCNDFYMFAKSKIHKEKGTEFQHQIWKNKRYLTTVELEES